MTQGADGIGDSAPPARQPHAGAPQHGSDDSVDAVLVERVRRKDRDAFGQLYERHSAMVYSIAISILRRPELAEDVAQDVFVGLWRQPERYNPALGRFAPWFYRVARNRAIDIVRQKRREIPPAEDGIFEAVLPDSDPEPADIAVLRSEAARVRSALGSLPTEQRQLIELAYFNGLTQSEMSERLNVPLGTVKTRVRSGLRRLREMLEAPE